MTAPAPAILPLGEAAWTVVLGDRVDPGIHERVVALAGRLEAAQLPGVREIVPAYAALTVFFDPRRPGGDSIREWLLRDRPQESAATPASQARTERPVLVIPVDYHGPDLDEVAARTSLSRAEVIRRHSEREYRVYLLGFAPGFAYLGDLDPALFLPRRSEPRTRVPAGSVAIAGSQTGVYPLATPGGWHLIGTTSQRMLDPTREPPVLLKPGDRVRFEVQA